MILAGVCREKILADCCLLFFCINFEQETKSTGILVRYCAFLQLQHVSQRNHATMSVATMLAWRVPPLLILAVVHLTCLPELEDSEVGSFFPIQIILADFNLSFLFCLMSRKIIPALSSSTLCCQIFDFVEFFSGAGRVSAQLRAVGALDAYTWIISNGSFFHWL